MSAGTDMSAKDADTTLDNAAHGGCPATTCYASSCGRVTLYLGDCRDIAPPMDSVDCILTDPPYPDQYEDEYDYRANGIDFLNQHKCLQLIFWSARFDLPLDYTAKHIWDKQMGAGRAEYEVIYERNGQGGYLMFRANLINNKVSASFQSDEYTGHPSQKPRKLLMKMIERLAKKSATIYDPFMGSGSTGVAAVRMGRRFIGIERNPAHYATALERIKNELAQGDLFLGHNA